MTFINEAKPTSVLVNEPLPAAGRIWNAMSETFDGAAEQWNNPQGPFLNEAKPSSSLVNESKP